MLLTTEKVRESNSLDDIAFGILDRCLAFHNIMWPDLSDEIVFDMYDKFMEIPASGDKAYMQMQEAIKRGEHVDINKVSLLITIAYVVEAQQAALVKHVALAAHLLMDASFWCGIMWSGQEIKSSQEKAIEKSKKKISQEGNVKRWEDQALIKKLIYEHVANRGDGRMWHSCASAAELIHKKFPELIAEISTKLKNPDWIPAEDTIEKWLLKMPASDHLFESKLARQSKK